MEVSGSGNPCGKKFFHLDFDTYILRIAVRGIVRVASGVSASHFVYEYYVFGVDATSHEFW